MQCGVTIFSEFSIPVHVKKTVMEDILFSSLQGEDFLAKVIKEVFSVIKLAKLSKKHLL